MNPATIPRAIARKRDGESLAGLWPELIGAYLANEMDEGQMGALMMACVLRGIDDEETRVLTETFVAGGERLIQSDPHTVDKHSTGGVGDSGTLIVVPWVAACGVPVAKLSGRSLGHTGGTLDKLEAVEGLHTDLTPERFLACIASAGCAIAAQSERIVPADKRIYALRDRTATVGEPGLIAASIVSKKIAGGAFGIVYDVKTGAGALMPRASEALALARTLVELTAALGRRAAALVTDMNEPMGDAVGTGLEVIEARDFLRGVRREPRLYELGERLALQMLRQARFEGDPHAALAKALASGAAAERFDLMLATQGARPGALDALAPHPRSALARARREGHLVAVDTVALGDLTRDLVVAHGDRAGLRVHAKIGDYVRPGDPLATVFGEGEAHGDRANASEGASRVAAAFVLDEDAPPARRVIYDEIEAGSGMRLGSTSAPAGRSTLETK